MACAELPAQDVRGYRVEFERQAAALPAEARRVVLPSDRPDFVKFVAQRTRVLEELVIECSADPVEMLVQARATFPNLKILRLRGPDEQGLAASRRVLEVIAGMARLQELTIERVSFTLTQRLDFSGLRDLQVLQVGSLGLELQSPLMLPERLVELRLGEAHSSSMKWIFSHASLAKLHVELANVNDDDFDGVEALINLELLDLDGGASSGLKIGDAALARLAGLPRLRVLSLANGPEFTAKGLAALSKSETTKQLQFLGVQFGKGALAPLCGMHSLAKLRLLECNAPVRELRPVLESRSLRELDIRHIDGTLDEFLGLVPNGCGLELLLLPLSWTVGERHLAGLQRLPKLRHIRLSGSLGLENAKRLSSFGHLESLVLDLLEVPAVATLTALSAPKSLRSLSLSISNDAADLPLHWLEGFPSLVSLSVVVNSCATPLANMPKCPFLKNLQVCGANLSEGVVRVIESSSALESLELRCSSIGGTTLDLSRLRNLRKLSIAGSGWANSDTVTGFAAVNSLQNLDVSVTSVDSKILKEVTKMSDLRTLNLSDTAITEDELATLRQKLPFCHMDQGWIWEAGTQ